MEKGGSVFSSRVWGIKRGSNSRFFLDLEKQESFFQTHNQPEETLLAFNLT